jgi:hypothetical protein
MRSTLLPGFLLCQFIVGGIAIGQTDRQTAFDLKPISQLPASRELPDPFRMSNGKRITAKEQWPARQAEILRQVMAIEYGSMPADAGEVKAAETASDDAAVHAYTLTLGPGGKVSVPLLLTFPKGNGPFPVIIKGDLCWGRVKPDIIAAVLDRGYALAEFDRTRVAPDKDDRSTGVFPLYPDCDWGALAGWAWGYSRVIDYLETRPDIDKARIIITGHSRGGKATLLAGALDERVALTVPNGSGCGGAGCYRVQWPTSENMRAIVTVFPYWFAPHFNQFIGHVEQLPFDQHELKAAVAPRALFTTDSLDDLWANPLGTQMSFLASREVFSFLGVPQKTGLHYRHGKHEQNLEDFTALMDFADWQLRGKQPGGKFDELPFKAFPKAYNWAAPQSQ